MSATDKGNKTTPPPTPEETTDPLLAEFDKVTNEIDRSRLEAEKAKADSTVEDAIIDDGKPKSATDEFIRQMQDNPEKAAAAIFGIILLLHDYLPSLYKDVVFTDAEFNELQTLNNQLSAGSGKVELTDKQRALIRKQRAYMEFANSCKMSETTQSEYKLAIADFIREEFPDLKIPAWLKLAFIAGVNTALPLLKIGYEAVKK